MKKLLGPVLSFRGSTDNIWKVSCLFVADINLRELTYGTLQQHVAMPILLHEYKGSKVWRFDMEILLGPTQTTISYRQDQIGESWQFHVPALEAIPQAAYASCNGFSHLKEAKKIEDKNALWKDLAEKHKNSNYHLLLMGGDQVYADPLWEVVSELKKWSDKDKKTRISASFSSTLRNQLNDFYFNLYCSRWSQPEVQNMLSSIPTIMMWDDHDIFDGWGSHLEQEQSSPVFQGIFSIAKDHFRIFQQQLQEGQSHPSSIDLTNGFTLAYNLGKLAILAMDMRSERTNDSVISANTWQKIYKWMDKLNSPSGNTKAQHLYVMSSIPIVHPDFTLIEDLLGVFPGQQSLEDDLRDHWHSRGHKGERLRLIHRLLSISEQKKLRVTILSGDVHVAALGVINATKTSDTLNSCQVINQLTSSGIVHPSPPAVVLLALKILGAEIENVDQGITTQLINFPGTKHSFVGSRNWLSLEPDDRTRVWANWFVEGESDKTPYTKVIHPINFEQ